LNKDGMAPVKEQLEAIQRLGKKLSHADRLK